MSRFEELMALADEYVANVNYSHAKFQAARAALERALRDALEPQGWISAKDRLPGYCVEVLIWNGRHLTVGYHAHTSDNDWWFRRGDQCRGVTHWMPLPAAPKEPTK